MKELEKYKPCTEAMEFASQFKTFEDAWNACARGDWMLWLAQKLGVNDRKLTLAKGYCAKTVIHLMKDERSVNAVNVAIMYGRYRATKEELNDAVAVAAAAATDATDDAYAAAYAATAAYDAAAAATDAVAFAAAYAAAAYYSAAYAAAKKQNQQQTAYICRKYLTKDVLRLI